jgi:transcriptional regulator with XRE-family HTH domain
MMDDESSSRDRVIWLRRHSGLTWQEIAMLFGVSANAVALWAAGGPMNATHLRMLTEIERVVYALPGLTARGRRRSLFAPREGRRSVYDQLLYARYQVERRRETRRESGNG